MSFTPGAGTRFLVSTGASGTTPLSGPLSITGGTATANTPVLSATQTWNNAAVTFTGWQLNVTDTASNANSLLMDLQVGGVSRFSVSKTGNLVAGIARQALFANYQTGSFSTTEWVIGLDLPSGTTGVLGLSLGGLGLNQSASLAWTNGANPNGNAGAVKDLFLFRDAANTLAQRNGVNAQTLRVYNTFTDASNYERGIFSWVSNALNIGTQNAGTGLNRNVEIVSGGISAITVSPSGAFVNAGIYGNGLTVDVGSNSYPFRHVIQNNGYHQMTEMTAPAAPAANSVRIYAEDNGSGKTRLMALFATGAAQQIAIEP